MKWLADHKLGVWAFAVAIAYVPGIMSAIYVGRWSVIAIGIPLLAPLTLQRLPSTVQFAIVAGMMWSAASVSVSPDKMQAVLELFFIACVVGVLIVASQAEAIDDAMTGMALGLGVSSVIGLTQLAGFHFVEWVTQRPAGLFYNSEVLAELSAPVFVWALVSRRWGLALCCLFPLIACDSRIAVVAVAVGAAFALRPSSRLLTVLLATACIVVGSVIVAHMSAGRFASLALRATFWLEAAYAVTPLGHGLGWFIARHTEDYAHSDALQAAAELGIGALIFATIPVYCLWKGQGSNAERAAFLAICVESLVSFPLHIPATAFVAAMLAGRLARTRFSLRSVGLVSRDSVGAGGFRSTADFAGGLGRMAVPVRSSYSRHPVYAAS